jgi:AhpD family alkylhydroperoxidase
MPPSCFQLLAPRFPLHRALSHGALPATIREQMALVAAETNGCDYCASAHTALGEHAGLSQAEITNALAGTASDPKADAAIHFAKLLLEKRGYISDSDFNQLQQAGFSEAEIAEIVAHVAVNVLTNYFNISMDTEIDFPVVRTQQAKAA